MTDKLRMSALNARDAQCIRGGDGDNGGTIIPEGYGPDNPIPNDNTTVVRKDPMPDIPLNPAPSEGGVVAMP